MKHIGRIIRFFHWTRRRGRNAQIAILGTIAVIAILFIAVVIGIINTISGDDSPNETAAIEMTVTPTATEVELTPTPAPPTVTVAPTATSEQEVTATTEPTPIATELPSETTEATVQPPTVTDVGLAYVQQAHEFLNELDAKVTEAETGTVDVVEWGAWSHDWNTRRQAASDECSALNNMERGMFACLPLGDLFNVWSAEDNRLNGQPETISVADARQSLEDDFALIEGQ